MGTLAVLNRMTLSDAAIAAAYVKGEDVRGLLASAQAAAAEISIAASSLAALLPGADPNLGVVNFVDSSNSIGANLNFADPYESGAVALVF